MTLINDTIRSTLIIHSARYHTSMFSIFITIMIRIIIYPYIFQPATHAAYANTKHYVMCHSDSECKFTFTQPGSLFLIAKLPRV